MHDSGILRNYLSETSAAIRALDYKSIQNLAEKIIEIRDAGGFIYIFGNGGSAATATHFCGDLIKGVSWGLEKKIKCLCLNDNLSACMAIANDISYSDIFSEQLKNFIMPGDLVIAISGSGNSENILKALELARSRRVCTALLCGFDGGKALKLADLPVHVKINNMEIAEDIHLVILHCIKSALMKILYTEKTQPA
ncbi:MAG TPA: phosphoheptose isomerase [Spirochaetia bacterium]|nr:phosphoheptose isomerase [Spirochaetia bacterium]